MTREEAIKILTILKAAYPNSYKNMTKEEANGTVNLWAQQFADVPYFVVTLAVNKQISKSTFPPAISEVKSAIKSMYWEAWGELNTHRNCNTLDEHTAQQLKQIMDCCSSLKQQEEPRLVNLLKWGNIKALQPHEEQGLIEK